MALDRDHLPSSTSEVSDSIKRGKDKIIQAYEMLPNYCLQEEVPELLNGLREAMKKYVILESKLADLKETKQVVAQEVSQSAGEMDKELTNLDEISEMLKREFSKAAEKHCEGFWEKDALYASMKDFEAEGAENPDEEVDDGEDLAVTGVTIQTIDPYTKREFVDPVKNTVCNHSYEKETILHLINTTRKVRCYHMGCNNRTAIKVENLVPDEDLKRHLARLRARAI